MHRYRINYVLLFGLAAATVVLGGLAVFLIHPWQVNRNAEWFRERSETALAEDDVRTAFDYQSKYVRYRQDDDEARIKLAHLAVDVSKLSDVTRVESQNAYAYLDDAVRRTSDPDLRRKLADRLIAGGRPGDAIIHIDALLANDPSNTELLALRVRSLFATKDYTPATDLAFRLIGYDKKTNTFDTEKATAADQPEIYSLLALTLAEVSHKPELAREVIDQMVEVNPESYDAHLRRSFFLRRINEEEEADKALAKAYELNPTDAAVLKLLGQVALQDKDYEKARTYLTEGLKNHPKTISFFQLLAFVEMQEGNREEAIELLDRGIKEFGALKSIELVLYKIDTLFQANDFEGVNEELEILDKMKLAPLEPLIAFQQARIKWQKQQWAESAKEFRRLRPLLFQFSQAQVMAGVMLGRAYERLGQYDLAAQTYLIVLQDRPEDERALAGLQRANKQRGQAVDTDGQGFDLNGLVRKMLALPEDEQDWKQIDDLIAENIEKRGLPETAQLLFRTQVFLDRKMFSEARDLIREALKIDPENVGIRLAAVKLLWQEPDSGPEKAMVALDKVEGKFGSSLQTLALRADLLTAIGGENVPQQLRSLAENLDEWEDSQKAQLYIGIAGKFQQLGLLEDSLHFWNLAAELMPNSLPVRMQLFNVALQKQDDAAMIEAQKSILELVQNKEDASYLLTEVKRLIIGYGKSKVTREELLGARKLLDQAMLQRAEWNELHIVYAQLLLVLKQDLDVALLRLNDALKFGPPNMKAVSLQVQLLVKQRLFQQAREKMELIPEAMRSRLLGGVEADILFETGEPENAFTIAQKFVELQSDREATQKWFANLATKANELEAAENAWKKAIEINPAEPSNWSQLMMLYARQKKSAELQNMMRKAHLALDAEYVPLLTAKIYEVSGRWKNAETIYRSIYADQPDKLPLAKRMAEFYLLWKASDPDYVAKAGVSLNYILRAANEGEVSPKDMPLVDWARREAALLLASAKDYQKRQQSLQLLMLRANDGKLSAADQSMRASILSSLRDPQSQVQAIQVLSQLRKTGQLNKKDTLLLANLLSSTGDWENCENLMLDALAAYPADRDVRAAYINLLIKHGEYTVAQNRLNRLKGDPKNRNVFLQLLARLAAKKGDQSTVRKALGALLPKDINGPLEPNQLAIVGSVARLAAELKDLDLAEKLLTLYVKQNPTAASELIQFHALQGDADKALAMMKKNLSQQPDAMVTLAVQMLRKRRPEAGDKYDEPVNRLIAAALRDDPDSAHSLLTQAESLEAQQKFNESIAAYDKLLKRDDVPMLERAAAGNNLSFLLGLTGQRLDEAETLVNQAMEYYGPIAALLDTRGVVRTAMKKYDLAIEDLNLAATVDHTPVTDYHLAQALMLAGDEKAALKRWNVAKEQGLKKEDLTLSEQAAFEEFAGKMQQL